MSYDVYLYEPCPQQPCLCTCHEGGPSEVRVFDSNYTSNCSMMWDAAGCPLREWACDKRGVRTAETLIEPLRAAIAAMEADPAKYEAMNPDNGWGSYQTVLPWLRSILSACEQHPKARLHVSN